MFLDEITYVEGFQQQLKNLFDRGVKCFVSSSSSSILRDDSYIEDYMQVGGMPEYVLRNNREYALKHESHHGLHSELY